MEVLSNLRLAVLIDADNVPHSNVKGMMEEIARYGTPTLKRIYGDWTNPCLAGWKPCLLENAITPIQQYGYTTGKNSTDCAMIIDAMDILYSQNVDGFCLVSSDSDFTRLAVRLREAGKKVIGMGEKKTPAPFIVACDKFIYIEIINGEQKNEKKSTVITDKERRYLTRIISTAIDDLTVDDEEWVFLGEIGTQILKKHPDFDPRNYHFLKLTPLIKELGAFEIEERVAGKKIKHIYIRNKSASKYR